MKKTIINKKIFIIILVFTLILVSGGVYFAVRYGGSLFGHLHTGTGSADNTDPNQARIVTDDIIGKPDVDFKLLKTGPADDWGSMPVPYFNPLGSYSFYESAEYIGFDNEPVTLHTLKGYTEKCENITGEKWVLKIPSDVDYTLNWMQWQTKKTGGTGYCGTHDHSTFSLKENDSVMWWADVRELESGGAEITVVKTNLLSAGKSLTVNAGDYKGVYYLETECTPGKLQTASIKLEGADTCGIQVDITGGSTIGNYKYHTQLSLSDEELNKKKTDTFVLDNLPITDGRLCWCISWQNAAAKPEKFTVSINDTADINKVKWGEAPGAIRVVGIPSGAAKVTLPEWASAEHTDISLSGNELIGIADENGDMLFTAPSGYYNVSIPSGLGDEYSVMRLVPVSAGEVTTVTIPDEMKASVGATSRLCGSFDIDEGGIELLNNSVSGNTGTVSFIINDPQDRELSLSADDIKISEEGARGTVTKVERMLAGSNVVLVLDSSGSMGDNMKPCIDAAIQFIKSLPEDTTIQVIQFAQDITLHEGTDKASALKALDKIKSVGATSLYDATGKALELLGGKKRGYAVIFSDGADSREPGVDGEGSIATSGEIIDAIKESGVTVFTIGFGKGHDPAILKAMSAASVNGAYYMAADKSALNSVFAAVAGKFGNQYTVTYTRPTIIEDESSTIPVVSLMLDRSGSMNIDPAEDNNVGWRMDKIKAVFHDFILNLPQGTLMQVGSFAEPEGGEEPRYDQITTDQKAPVLQAVGSLIAGGSTPTLTALNMAYNNLAPIPSQKRVLVFFTDAALYDPENADVLDIVLGNLKNSGIRVLFAGLATGSEAESLDEIFKNAAEKAGGDYILTDSMDKIAEKLNELLNRIDTPVKKTGVDFTMGIDYAADDGSKVSLYTAKNLSNCSPVTGKGKPVSPQTVNFASGEPYVIYDRNAAQLITGSDQPGVQSRVILRMSFDNMSKSNKFAELKVKEVYLLDVFKGIEAPQGKLFLALNAELAFKKSDASSKVTAYQIPDIFNHFYVSVNEGQMMPASEATWLAECPFAMPGECSIQVDGGNSRSGALIFLVDAPESCSNINQLSLHLYDTQNGHIEISLIGKLTSEMISMSSLPVQVTQKITDAFSMKMIGMTDLTSLMKIDLPQSEDSEYNNNAFRVLEAQFDTKVQALLDIDPVERFLYQIDTDKGVLLVPMSDIVYKLPLGFSGKTMLAPGSCSKVRMPFVLPRELLNVNSYIYGDLSDGSLLIPVVKGSAYKTGGTGKTFNNKYFSLTVNSFTLLQTDGNQAVLDFTLTDKKDGQGTGGIESVLMLQRSESMSDSRDSMTSEELQMAAAGRKGLGDFTSESENTVSVDSEATSKLLFGVLQKTGSWGAYDGQSRRGIMIFTLPDDDPSGWVLTCSEMLDMSVELGTEPYKDKSLLAEKPEIPVDDDFENALSEAVTGAVSAYESTSSEQNNIKSVGLSDSEIIGNQVPAPSLTIYGTQKIKAVKTDDDFYALMQKMNWLPGMVNKEDDVDSAMYRYAPEAVITQGWGAQNDLSVLARTLLARLGYQPKYRTVVISAEGKAEIGRISGIEEIPDKLIGIAYTDGKGNQKLFIPVFNKDISELNGMCCLATDETPVDITPQKGRLTIELYGKLIGNAGMAAAAGMMNDIGSVLGGGEGDGDFYETVTVFDRELSLPDMSLDLIDISYISTAKSEGGEMILPVLDTRQGFLYDSDSWVDTSSYKFEQIIIRLDEETVHTTLLGENQKLTEVFHTLAWNVPELAEDSAGSIEQMAEVEASAADNPANYSVSRWLGHETIGRLVKGLSDMGRETSEKLNIKAGRSTQSIALLVTMKSDGKRAEATVDLMNHRNQLHNGSDEQKHAYNIMYGYFASNMEAKALPGSEGIDYMDVWKNIPEDGSINVIGLESETDVDAIIEILDETGYPTLLLERMRKNAESEFHPTIYIYQTKPSTVNGKEKWAWLEIDMETYDTVSVFDTGERAGMCEYLVGCFPKTYAEIGVGIVVGITTSVGSVAAYSLSIDDYKEVMAAALNLSEAIGEQLEFITGVTDIIGAHCNVWEGVNGVPIAWEKIFEGLEGLWVNKFTFMEGYNMALDAYFGR
ncbi:MAG: VWA domain-containing protein [Oscillospiraceae bacterium]|nr:VWA domain-containing protein [Oscillospiraceae bacterium]